MAKLTKATTARTTQLEVYIPNRNADGQRYRVFPDGLPSEIASAHIAWLAAVERAVCALPGGGGCSTYSVDGRWGEAFEDTYVVRATVLVDGDGSPVGLRPLTDLLADFGRLTNQAAVGLTLDGVWYFVSADAQDGSQ